MRYPALKRVLDAAPLAKPVRGFTEADLDEGTDLSSYQNHLNQAIQSIDLALLDVKDKDPNGDEIEALNHCKQILSGMLENPGQEVVLPGAEPMNDEPLDDALPESEEEIDDLPA